MRQLQRLRVLDQDAVLCSHTRACHDGCGRRQTQCTRTGDYQHRHSVDQCQLKRVACQPPGQQSGKCKRQHNRHKYRADLVHQALDRRLGSLCVFHQTNDVGQHRLIADRPHLHHHTAVAVDGAARELVPWRLGHRQRLACEHGFIDLGLAFQQGAVHRKAFSGFDHNAVSEQHLSHRHVHLAIPPE